MIIKKKFDKQTVKKVLDVEARCYADYNDELSLLWKAIEELASKMNVELPVECTTFRDAIKFKKQIMKEN